MSDLVPYSLPCAWVLTLAAAGWTVATAAETHRPRTRFAWYALVAAAAFAFRWRTLVAPHEFSPDESQSIAGALTLLHDPRFWISVDGATAGPLHFFVHLPAVVVGASYFGARVIALLLVLATIISSARILVTSESARQVLVLTAASAYATIRMPDLQHFSTELVPIFLMAVAAGLAFEGGTFVLAGRRRAFVAGLLLGVVPWAKLQAAPVAAFLSLMIAVSLLRRKDSKPLVALCVGTLLPTLFVAVYLSMMGAWQEALVPYAFNNVSYVHDGSFPVGTVVSALIASIREDPYFACSAALASLLVLIGFAWGKPTSNCSPTQGATLAVGWLVVSVACLLIPRRPYGHYLYLTLSPLLLVVGCALERILTRAIGSAGTRQRVPVAIVLAVFLVPLGALHIARADSYAWLTGLFERWHRENVTLAATIQPYTESGDSLAIWGSRSDLYVSTGLRQAIPQAHTQTQLTPGPWQPYFLRVYAEAFSRNQPEVFVDAVGPGNFLFENRAFAHEAFPLLRSAVRSGYTLLTDTHGTRVYIRNDRFNRDTFPVKPPAK